MELVESLLNSCIIKYKVNPTIINLFMLFGKSSMHDNCCFNASQLLSHPFSKYVKPIEVVMIHDLGFVEDECCFNSISFLKNKMHNSLNQLL